MSTNSNVVAPDKLMSFDALWHTLAVGLYYREHAELLLVEPWERQTLAVKLDYQRRAKFQLAKAIQRGPAPC